jgi:hypothetical protein
LIHTISLEINEENIVCPQTYKTDHMFFNPKIQERICVEKAIGKKEKMIIFTFSTTGNMR